MYYLFWQFFFSFFFSARYYFSDENLKKSFRSINNLDFKIKNYENDLTVLKNDTDNIIDYVKKDSLKNNKKYYFWNLLKNND